MIDFHSHFFSYTFFETLAKLSPLPGTPEEKLAGVVAKIGLELPDRDIVNHWARWQGQMDSKLVDFIVSFASVPEEIPALVEAKQVADGRLIPFAILNPLAEGAAAKARELLVDQEFGGLLFFPAMHKFHLGGPEAEAVFRVVDEVGSIVVVHCGELQVKLRELLSIPQNYDLQLADPLHLIPVANKFPRATFVIPHFGAGKFEETLKAGSECKNVYVDTSSSNSWMATQEPKIELAEVFRRALAAFGKDRILFGTDSSTMPRGWRSDLWVAQKAALESLGVDKETRLAIFEGNARRLLRI